jgi:gamma-glutamylputrescine oxidase
MSNTALLSDDSYYHASVAKETYTALRGKAETSVCIIGAGFAGLATAISLIERGERNVMLLDAETVGHGASGRNGGFVFGGYSLGERDLNSAVGLAQARDLYQLSLVAVEMIRHRIEKYQIDCDARYAGVFLANWFDDDRLLDGQQRFMHETLGVEWQRYSRQQLAERLHSHRYFGGLFEENAFHFHPLKYARGIAKAIVANGARVHEQSRVTKIVADGAGWRVETAQGEVKAREVVICCGGYIEKLSPTLASAILPIATYVMVTEPLGDRLQSAMQTDAAVYDTRFAFDYYRPLPDTRLLWGGRISIRERGAPEVARLLYRDMLKVYPQLAGTRVEYAWSGLMSYGRHKMPQMGKLPNGLWYGMGFGGHGVAPTTLAGELLARGLLGDVSLVNKFSQWGLPRTGGAAGLLAAQLTYWYYELRDWMRE